MQIFGDENGKKDPKWGKKDTSQYKKKEQLKKGTGYRIEKYS